MTADIISILIHTNTLISFVWSSIALNIHVSHFKNWLFSFVVSLQKWLMHFNCFRNDGDMKVLKVHRTCHSINGGLLEITHVFHLSIITSYEKKYFKNSLSRLTKKVSLKKLYIQYCLQCKYTICINPIKI